MTNLTDWIGREEEREEVIAIGRARAMEATLDREPILRAGDDLPALWNWLYFNEAAKASELGADGHPERGGFLPPVPLPRRMWAGGRFRFTKPLRIGECAVRRSRILSVKEKTGRSGALCFVTVLHEFDQAGHCFAEEHDIVYRAMQDGQSEPSHVPAPDPVRTSSKTIVPSTTLLFRYSALTFNGHRIHYDRDYAVNEEHYPGLVFHGPLTATLLAGLAPREMKRFDYRARAPIFDTAPFEVYTDGEARCWATTPDGGLAMEARYET